MDPVVATTVRGALAVLFAAAASHKLRAPARFVATVRDYRLGPPQLAPAQGALLVLAEVAAAALLAAGGRPAGALLAAGLLGLYATAIATNLARGRRHLDCGCAGPGAPRTIHGGLVVRNLVLLAAALALLVPVAPRPLGWVDATTIVAAVAALAALYAAVDRLMANAPGVARLRGAA